MQGGDIIEDVGLQPEVAGQRGLKMLTVLSYVFSAHFQHSNILRHLIALLSFDEEYVAPYILKAFTYLGRFKPLIIENHDVLEELAPICKEFAISGNPKQAKHAIRCMFVNTDGHDTQTIEVFADIVESLKTILHPEHPNYRTGIVALGHIAYNLPDKFQVQIKNLISRKIVKDLLVKDTSSTERSLASDETWCTEDELPEETLCKVEGLKTMARWLLGLKQDVLSAQKTFRMLNAFIKQRGDLLESGNLSPAEMSWLRLSAGTAMLRICEQKGVGDQFTHEQFYTLSQLMVRSSVELRFTKSFVEKKKFSDSRSIQFLKYEKHLHGNYTKDSAKEYLTSVYHLTSWDIMLLEAEKPIDGCIN